MVQKHNFSEIGAASDPMTGMFSFLNGSDHTIFYAILLIVMVVSTYVFLRRTQDIGKSMLFGLHVTTFITIIFFYWGLSTGNIFIPELILLSLVVIEILSVSGLYYVRNKGL